MGNGAMIPDPRWVVGDSAQALAALPDASADMVLTCPPYFDLERYSDDERDLSAMKWEGFEAAFREIIRQCARVLKENRFACVVISDVRDAAGIYRGLPKLTAQAFEAAGMGLLNEAILVPPLGSVPMRAAESFEHSRKLGKAHQTVLVFVKGDASEAARAVGPVDFSLGLEEGAEDGGE